MGVSKCAGGKCAKLHEYGSKMNNSSDQSPTLDPDFADVQEWLRAVHGTVVAVLLVASLAGNLLLLYLVWKYRQLRYRSILVSLGVVIVDLLLPIFMHLQALISTIAGRWPLEDEGCVFFGYVLLCLQYVRWLNTGVIAIDRFLVIVFPFWYRRWSKPLLIALTVLAWVVPLASNLSAVVGFGEFHFRSTLTFCTVNCPEGSSEGCLRYYTFAFGFYLSLGGFLPTVLYLSLYCLGRRKKWTALKRMGTLSDIPLPKVDSLAMNGDTKATQPLSRLRSRSLQLRRSSSTSSQQARDRRAAVTFVAIFITLIGTQVPIFIMQVSRRNFVALYTGLPIWGHFIFFYIFLLASVLDPLIIMRNQDFRHAFSNLLGRRHSFDVSSINAVNSMANGTGTVAKGFVASGSPPSPV